MSSRWKTAGCFLVNRCVYQTERSARVAGRKHTLSSQRCGVFLAAAEFFLSFVTPRELCKLLSMNKRFPWRATKASWKRFFGVFTSTVRDLRGHVTIENAALQLDEYLESCSLLSAAFRPCREQTSVLSDVRSQKTTPLPQSCRSLIS